MRRRRSSTDIESPSGTAGFARFGGTFVGPDGLTWPNASSAPADLALLKVFKEVVELVLVNMARGALEGSSAASLEIVPLGGLYMASGTRGRSAMTPAGAGSASGASGGLCGPWGSGGTMGCVRMRGSCAGFAVLVRRFAKRWTRSWALAEGAAAAPGASEFPCRLGGFGCTIGLALGVGGAGLSDTPFSFACAPLTRSPACWPPAPVFSDRPPSPSPAETGRETVGWTPVLALSALISALIASKSPCAARACRKSRW